MAILSVDLAYRRWSDLGVVILDRAGGLQSPASAFAGMSSVPPPLFGAMGQRSMAPRPIACEVIPMAWEEGPGPVDAEILAGRLNRLCAVRDIRVILLDGPQAWKSCGNGLKHCRVSEQQLNTAGKTGLPGMVKPVTYRAFAEFCLDVYDAFCRRGWRRLETREQPGAEQERVLVESYPHAAWKSLGLKPLPSKRRAARQITISFRRLSADSRDWRSKSGTQQRRALWAIRLDGRMGTGGRDSLCFRCHRRGRRIWHG